jgi:hypothetical protein
MSSLGFFKSRPLNDWEIEHRIDPKERINDTPLYQSTVIKINSTYLEIADAEYAQKGFKTTAMLGMLMFGIFACLSLLSLPFTTPSAPARVHDIGRYLAPLFGLVMFIPLTWLVYHIFLLEAFDYTHYPIRFNRQTRMVYVFDYMRLKFKNHWPVKYPPTPGKILAVPWDEVYFTLDRRDFIWNIGGVQGLILKDDKVVDEFYLPAASVLKDPSIKRHWELIRRYLEEGPEAVIPHISSYLPINERKETFIEGMINYMHIAGGRVAYLPMAFFMYLVIMPGRNLGLITNKVPKWPQWVEEACAVPENDPHWRDCHTHPYERDWDKDHERTVPANQPLYPNKKPKVTIAGVDPLVIIAAIVPWSVLVAFNVWYFLG